MSNTQSDESPDEETVFPFIINSLNDRGQTRFCKKLLKNLFEPGISPCKTELPDVKIKDVEDYLNAVLNLFLNIGPEPINTPLHQNWIHRRTALKQKTLDGAAQKCFSALPKHIKSDWKRITQEFSKMFDSERNKQHQRVLCNEIRRLPDETIKHLAVRIETLLRKPYSLNKHDYKNTK